MHNGISKQFRASSVFVRQLIFFFGSRYCANALYYSDWDIHHSNIIICITVMHDIWQTPDT